ncbi:aldehyde dehydrogenase [Mycolicibacterium setense]|uniref:aldehyde dehydrogenase n=1 Tax=Mycolicibacterium setense TaxID=431269 RepID=UPI0007E981F5|nr:aldehyde dehydrogenase [Mycolicibacterium setense]OBB17637.1 aldehyde dehydrogenase [Mycolicibacterium setense]
MTVQHDRNVAPVAHPDRFFIGGEWVKPSTDSSLAIIDPATEELYFRAAEAQAADVSNAVGSARRAFDEGPWPRLTHAERAEFLTAIAAGLRARTDDGAKIWSHETGVLFAVADGVGERAGDVFDFYAGLADTYSFEEQVTPTMGGDHGLLVREPVGVVGMIVPWNSPLVQIPSKLAPALLAGCTVVVKLAPEAPAHGYLLAEIVEQAGLPPGVVNVVTADREVSELLVRDPRVDKVGFTGSTAAGRRIASLCGERIARVSLELGGKSAAVILDDYDLEQAAHVIAEAETLLTGQVCSSLTRIVVSRGRHDEFVDALASVFGGMTLGNPFDEQTQMGPLAMRRQRDRVESYIAKGIAEGATLAAGGGRPVHLDRGWYIEPTVFGNVDNSSTIARDEIFGPVLSVIPAADECDAVAIANDSIYGLNASVFTNDMERAIDVSRRLRSGTVGHNAFRSDSGVSFGGFKQSGIGREGGVDGLLPYLETKLMILDGHPTSEE